MEEEKVVLDRQSFEALAVDTRVRILKSLRQRRKTLSELAKEQKMSVSGIKEHLETLEKVGLVEKIDDGHKWKYYELTRKGSDIVAPKELRVWILLSISTLALVASMFMLISYPGAAPQEEMMAAKAPLPPEAAGTMAAESDAQAVPSQDEPVDNGAYRELAAAAPEEEPQPETPAEADLAVPVAVAAVSAVTIAACIGILLRNRMRATYP